MPWVLTLGKSTQPPEFQMGKWVDWEKKVADVKVRAEVSNIFHRGGCQVDLALAPRSIDLETSPDALPPIFTSCDGVKIISRRVKNIIEKTPNQSNQIIPITISSSGKVDDHAWYALNVFAEKKSIIRDLSSVIPHFAYKDSWKVAFIDHDAPDRRMVLTPAALEGPHLWRETGYAYSLFMSDELKEDFDKDGVDLYDTWHAEIKL